MKHILKFGKYINLYQPPMVNEALGQELERISGLKTEDFYQKLIDLHSKKN